jgi:hypothetical protein
VKLQPQDEPLRRDGAWVLPHDTFERFWNNLSPVLRAEFDLRGGDTLHARFVCAIVLLSNEAGNIDGNVVVIAWSMATEQPLEANALHAQAAHAFERECVRTMLERLWRQRRNLRTQLIAERSAKLLEAMVEQAMDAPVASQAKAVASSAAYLRFETLENERVADEQRRLGVDKAAAQLGNAGQTLDEIPTEQLEQFSKAITLALQRKKQRAIGPA